MRITTPVLLAGFATVAVVTKISLDHFLPHPSRLVRKWFRITAPAATIAIAPAAIGAQQLQWTPLTFTTDAGETTDAERAIITVPERHANPGGASIKLPLIRFRSKAANPGPPIVYLAGGPGNSGLSAAKRDQYFPGIMALREIADVITFDQRGTGAAEPSLAVDMRFDLASDEPIGSPKARATLAKFADSAARIVRARGIDLAAYNTQESADDVDAIRRALGAEKISLWGHSYGSHLGLAYIKRHGTRVHRAILGGVNGLDQRWRYPSEGQTWLESIDAATKQDPRLRAIMPDFIGTTRRAIARLEANPARVTVNNQPVLIGADEIRTMFVLQGGESDFVKRLPLIVSNLDKGEVAPFAGPVRAVLRGRPLGTAMTYAMHIASGVSPAQLRRIEREAPGTILGDAINYPFSDAGFRTAWGAGDLGESFRSPVKSAVPTMFISGTLDGRTSIAAAREVKKGFSNGTHVILRGAAHDIYAETPALITLMTRFIRGEKVADTNLDVPLEFHGPDEPALIQELRTIVLEQGADAAIARARTYRAQGSGNDLTSYVMADLAAALDRNDKKPAESIAILRAATEMFPANPVLFMRLGAAQLAAGDKASAAAAYRKALQLNPLLRFGAVQLAKIEAAP
jgi:pimeloyl-ACP methyl ester carboxylesterase